MKIAYVLTVCAALGLSACAADSATTGANIVKDSYEAGKTAAITTGVNAVTGKLTGGSTTSMTDIAKETMKSGKNAAITKASSSLTGSTATTTPTTTTTTTPTTNTKSTVGGLLNSILQQ